MERGKREREVQEEDMLSAIRGEGSTTPMKTG